MIYTDHPTAGWMEEDNRRAEQENVRCSMTLETAQGERVTVVQITGDSSGAIANTGSACVTMTAGSNSRRASAKSSCFCNLSVTHPISVGCLLADIPAIVGSLDIVMGEIDR